MQIQHSLCIHSTLFRVLKLMAALAVGVAVSANTWAQGANKNLLETLDTSTQQGGKIIIRATFKEPLPAVPTSFTVTNPSRIALDLPNVLNGLGKNQVDIGEGDLRSISVVEVADRTRMVLNLSRNLKYTATLEGKSLVLTVDNTASPTTTTQTVKFAEPIAAAGTSQTVRDIDFRRGPNGEGRVIVDLSSSTGGIDIKQQGKTVIVDLIGTSVPRNLIRKLDVLDFGTPVRLVEISSQGNDGRIIIEPKGLWEYSAYQTDNQFIVEVKPIKEDTNKLVQGIGYSGEKVTFNFQSIEIRQLLQVIADFSNFNIVTGDSVNGTLTLRLKEVPWDQALDIIMQYKGLSSRKNGNVLYIAPTDEIVTKEKLALEQGQQVLELEPLRTENFVLSYAKAADMKALLGDKDQKILSKRGSVNVDTRTNILLVQDVPSRLEEVRRLIRQLDTPVPQVVIEARIVIADDRFSRQLGARLGVGAGTKIDGRNVGIANNIPSSSSIANGATPTGGSNVDLPVVGAAGSLALTFLNLGNGNIVNLELSALESDSRGQIVSAPRILTNDKKKANIYQGTEIPYITQTAGGVPTIQFKQVLLSLDVTPQITPDDKIIMDLEVKKDTVGALVQTTTGAVPSIDTKRLSTQIVVNNGDTAVLGGIFEQTTRSDVTKVPLLGDIPIIGNFFRTTTKQNDKIELLIFITPRIVKDQLTLQ